MLGEAKQLKQMFQDSLRNIHTCIPGEIKSYDASKSTASIQPHGKFKKADGSYLDYPELSNVPVIFPQYADQKATIAFPIKEGDGCFLFFAEQQLDTWKDGREPKSDIRHGLTNAIAIMGLFTDSNEAMEDACNDDAIIIDREKTRVVVKDKEINVLIDKDSKDTEINATTDKVHVKRGGTEFTIEDGKVTVKSATISLDGNLEVTGYIAADNVIHSKVDVQSSTVSLVGHGHASFQASATPAVFPSPKEV